MRFPGALSGIGQTMFPQGGQGLGAALGVASPLLLAMGSGLSSGRGLMADAPVGLALMMAGQEKKRKEEAEKAALDAMASLGAPGAVMGGAPAVSGMAAPAGAAAPVAPAPAASGRHSPSPSMARDMFATVEEKFRLPKGYLDRSWEIESGRGKNLDNPNSSAAGHFQWMPQTAAQYGAQPGNLGNEVVAVARFASDNAKVLTDALGREPTAGELYLAHQQGAGGAAKLLANPGARAADIVGPQAVALNGGNPDMTAQEFAGMWMSKFGGSAGVDPASDPWINSALKVLENPNLNPAAREALQTRIQMRMQSLQGQEGISPDVAARLGMEQWKTLRGEPYTLGENAIRYDGQNQPVAMGMPETQDPYTLRPGDVRYGSDNQPIAAGAPESQDPLSTLGKLKADLDAGRIPVEMFNAEMQRMANEGAFYAQSDGAGGFTIGTGAGAANAALRENQSKDNFYLASIEHAGPILDQYEKALVGLAGAANDAAGMVPVIGKFMQSSDYQVARAAVKEWGAPILRKESGAALTNPDYKWLEDRYIPVPGEKEDVIAQKRDARKVAEAGIRSGMSQQQIDAVAASLKSVMPNLDKGQLNAMALEQIGRTVTEGATTGPNAPPPAAAPMGAAQAATPPGPVIIDGYAVEPAD